MGYALFAQRKLVLTSQLNSKQLQQTQRANEQYALATRTASLQQELISLGASQASELSEYYGLLANVQADGSVVDRTYDPNNAAAQDIDQSAQLAALNITQGQDAASTRANIQAAIENIELKFAQEEEKINRKLYEVSIKENAIEMEVKRLDTEVTAIQKQLEAIQEAEGQGIDKATPKFKGLG